MGNGEIVKFCFSKFVSAMVDVSRITEAAVGFLKKSQSFEIFFFFFFFWGLEETKRYALNHTNYRIKLPYTQFLRKCVI